MSFNLKRYLEKTATYEGAQGYFVGETRTWQNCVRLKMNSGATAMDCWQDCLNEYQKDNGSLKWIADNVHEDSIKKSASGDEMQEWTSMINIQLQAGNTMETAVQKTINFFRQAEGACVSDKNLVENHPASNDGDSQNANMAVLDDLSEAARKIKNRPLRPYKDQSKSKHPKSGRLDPQTDARDFQKNYKYDGEQDSDK